MIERNLICLIALFSILPLCAQELTSSTNSMRHGDILYKIEVPYRHEGESGEDCTWRLAPVPRNSKDFVQEIISNRDTIAVLEQGHMIHYLVRGDSVFLKAEQYY